MSILGPDGRPVGTVNISQENSPSRELHLHDDVDFDRNAHHHTLGYGPFQAAPGGDFNGTKDWTPVITAETGAFNGAPNAPTALGKYILVGNFFLYTVDINMPAASIGTAANGVRFTFPVNIDTNWLYIGSGREYQATGVMVSVTRIGNALAQVYNYANAPILAGAAARRLSLEGFFLRAP